MDPKYSLMAGTPVGQSPTTECFADAHGFILPERPSHFDHKRITFCEANARHETNRVLGSDEATNFERYRFSLARS
jgi:hypothetical protein